MKKRKWYQRRKIIYSLHILVFILFIIFYESYTIYKTKFETQNLSKFVNSFVWNLDDASAGQYLEVYLQNNPISSIKILHPDKSTFVEIQKKGDFSLSYNILKTLFIIRNYSISVPIQYENEIIGSLTIIWINENIYIYIYAFIIFLFLSIIAHFYIETIKQKNIIQEALQEIKALKVQQDADYYLTSLLIQPLTYIQLNSDFVKYVYYIEQKKKFDYKKYHKEIGGDFIILKKIYLKNQNYVFFINADAMGKSLQGGSGVLVLGSILYAILKRLEIKIEEQQRYPETWLKYLALEIQELFESFQGSMMLSAVIGLLNEQSGILYYINFEHPYPIIYRNGQASFLGQEYILRKIGMPKLFQEEIKIQIFELQEGDIFIVGSDGKDDLELTVENQTRVINEDETLFLKIVEKSEGDINLIKKYILEAGNLTDDISILMLNLLKKQIPVIESIPSNKTEELIKLMKQFLRNKEYQKLYNLFLPYIEEYAYDNQILYYFSACCYNLKKYEQAIDIGERILNRKNLNENIYPILIKAYLKVQDIRRAKFLLNQFKNYTSKEDLILNLEEDINHRMEQIKDRI